MAEDIKRYQQSPEYQAILQTQREKGLADKRATKLAKRGRRLEKLVAKRLASWDAYDQFLVDQSAWEGLKDTRETE